MPHTVDELTDFLIKHYTDKNKTSIQCEDPEEGFYNEMSTGRDFESLHEYYERPSLETANTVRVDVGTNLFPFFESLEDLFNPRALELEKEDLLTKWPFEFEFEPIYNVCETPDEIWQQALEKTRKELVQILGEVGYCIDTYRLDKEISKQEEARKEIGAEFNWDLLLQPLEYDRVKQPYLSSNELDK